MTTDGHQIHLPVGDIDGNLSDGLRGVGVEVDSFRATDLTCGQEGKRSINQSSEELRPKENSKIRKRIKALRDQRELLYSGSLKHRCL